MYIELIVNHFPLYQLRNSKGACKYIQINYTYLFLYILNLPFIIFFCFYIPKPNDSILSLFAFIYFKKKSTFTMDLLSSIKIPSR